MKLNILHDKFPEIYEIITDIGFFIEGVYIFQSPFCNCQTFSIGGINYILRLPKELQLEILQLCLKRIPKNQTVIDIRKKDYNKFYKNFSPYIFKIQEMSYENNNGTPMVLILITWDVLKILS